MRMVTSDESIEICSRSVMTYEQLRASSKLVRKCSMARLHLQSHLNCRKFTIDTDNLLGQIIGVVACLSQPSGRAYQA